MKNVATEQHQGLTELGLTDAAARVLIVDRVMSGDVHSTDYPHWCLM